MSIPASVRLPVGVEPLRLRTGRGTLAALHAGSGPRVLFVPGFTGSKEDFLAVLPLLSAAGFEAVAIDLAGQFESEHPAAAASMTGWSQDLVDVLRVHEGPTHVVGHSFGGLICRGAALLDPARFASLTLLDSGPAALPEDHWQRLRLLQDIVPNHTMDQIWELKEDLDRIEGVAPEPEEIRAFLHRRWVSSSGPALAAMAAELTTATDLVEELAALGLPIAVLYGVSDTTAWPTAWQADMAARLGVVPQPIPDAAHSPAAENPAATAASLVRFLSSVQV